MGKIIQSEKTFRVRSRKKRVARFSASGQSLVEYALILVFVSLAVLVIASIIGLAVQRIYGVVGGAVGGTHITSCSGGSGNCDPNQHYLTISEADCFISSVPPGNTILVIRGEISNVESTPDPNYDINFSTDAGVLGTSKDAGVGGYVSIGGTANGLVYTKQLANGANAGACPHSATVQTRDLIAVSPVTVKP